MSTVLSKDWYRHDMSRGRREREGGSTNTPLSSWKGAKEIGCKPRHMENLKTRIPARQQQIFLTPRQKLFKT